MSAWSLAPLFVGIAGLAIYALGRAMYPAPITWDVEPTPRPDPETIARDAGL